MERQEQKEVTWGDEKVCGKEDGIEGRKRRSNGA